MDDLRVGRIARALRHRFAVFDAEVVVYVRLRGGDVDRLLDRGHAERGERFLGQLVAQGWSVAPLVSFSEFGERGSIDLLAWHASTRSLLVIEIKTELTSIEETIRRHDTKARLARKIAKDRLGWDATAVSRFLVLPDDRTPRRQVERHGGLFRQAYPMRGWAVRGWLTSPALRPSPGAHAVSGLLFLSPNAGTRARRTISGKKRISAAQRRPSGPKSTT